MRIVSGQYNMKEKSQLLESIDRFRRGFWEKTTIDRPPVGIAPDDVFLPIKYLYAPFKGKEITPNDLSNDLFTSDYDFAFADRSITTDDMMPFSAAWRAIPWLEAICGCPVRYATGSMAPGHFVKSLKQLLDVPFPASTEWFETLKQQTQIIENSLPDDCWLSPTILRGPSDIISAMRGLTEFYCDLADDISIIDNAAAKVNSLLLHVLDMHFSIVPPKLDGYSHIFGYWAPEKTIVIQEDAMGMCSADTYRDIFMKYNTDIVRHLGKCVFFHIHSTGYKHYKDVLEIPGIAGLEITLEANGPSLMEVLPVLKEILQKTRLILFADHYFEQLPDALPKLPKEGLYLIISDKYINSDKQFKDFTTENW